MQLGPRIALTIIAIETNHVRYLLCCEPLLKMHLLCHFTGRARITSGTLYFGRDGVSSPGNRIGRG